MPGARDWHCEHLDPEGRVCWALLGVIHRGYIEPRAVVTRIDDYARFTVRCPSCDHEQRWTPRVLLRRGA